MTYLQIIFGLEIDAKLGSLFQTLICLVRECFPTWKSSVLNGDVSNGLALFKIRCSSHKLSIYVFFWSVQLCCSIEFVDEVVY